MQKQAFTDSMCFIFSKQKDLIHCTLDQYVCLTSGLPHIWGGFALKS